MRCMHRIALSVAVLVIAAAAPAQAAKPQPAAARLQVFILAGQSNMEGKARVELAELQSRSEAPALREFYRALKPDGQWLVRRDVWIDFLDRRGELTVGFGSPGCIGPELGFGIEVGDHFDAPVLLIKTAWGGRSLGRDFLPPNAPQPSDDDLQRLVDKENADNEKHQRPPVDLATVRGRYGQSYRDMLRQVHAVLDDLPQRFPAYRGQGFELAGMVWFQGWNDQYDESFVSGYQQNLADLVRAVRRDLDCPKLPVVIGQMGQNGLRPATGNMARIKAAQAAVAEMAEFRGNVACVATDVFWDRDAEALIDGWEQHREAWQQVGSDRAYHYLGSVRTFVGIGRAFGTAMLGLLAGK